MFNSLMSDEDLRSLRRLEVAEDPTSALMSLATSLDSGTQVDTRFTSRIPR